MKPPPPQLLAVAAKVDEALSTLFVEERATWAKLNPALDVPLADLADFVASGGQTHPTRILPLGLGNCGG